MYAEQAHQIQHRWWINTYHSLSLSLSLSLALPPSLTKIRGVQNVLEPFGFLGGPFTTLVVNLVTRSELRELFVNFRLWPQLLVIVTVTRVHERFSGELRGSSRPDFVTVKPCESLALSHSG
jgi:hypothetical protein